MLTGRGNDERTDRNINRACRNAFALGTIVATFSIAYVQLSKAFGAMPPLLALLSQGVLIFGLSYMYYDRKGSEDPYEDADRRV
jgi:archaellum biogenesis protein FlaJ (TadC family)